MHDVIQVEQIYAACFKNKKHMRTTDLKYFIYFPHLEYLSNCSEFKSGYFEVWKQEFFLFTTLFILCVMLVSNNLQGNIESRNNNHKDCEVSRTPWSCGFMHMHKPGRSRVQNSVSTCSFDLESQEKWKTKRRSFYRKSEACRAILICV